MTKVGYARVSTRDQHPEAQRERLIAAGCDPELIFTDHGVSGTRASRPGWDECLAKLRRGDTLVCVKLDRIGRSVTNLIEVIRDLDERGVDLVCLDQPIDTTSAMGKMLFKILAVFAEFEHDLIVERTRDGLAASPARGRNGGRRHRLTPEQQQQARGSVRTVTRSGTSASCSGRRRSQSAGRPSTGPSATSGRTSAARPP